MKQAHALIVEDDCDLANILAQALQMAEYAVEVILDGKQALEQLKSATPNVVVLDLHLPHVSGQDILRQIRAQARLAETRVILATADPVLADSLRDEADLVLIKPISIRQLRDLAARLRPPDTFDLADSP
jgi:DNA-binding response OmpR family regulator